MKPTHIIIRFLNGNITEDALLAQVPEAPDLVTGFRDVFAALGKEHGTKVTFCSCCGALLLRRRVKPGQSVYCDADRCQKLKKLGHDKPVTLDSIPEPTRSCSREIQSYHGGYSD